MVFLALIDFLLGLPMKKASALSIIALSLSHIALVQAERNMPAPAQLWPPAAQEIAKAPPWPSVYKGDLATCTRLDEKEFLRQTYDQEKQRNSFQVFKQIDLNQDGVCEILAMAHDNCGHWGCPDYGFQLKGTELAPLGIIPSGEYLVPYGGWLQIRAMDPGSGSIEHVLYRYAASASPTEQAYRPGRLDEFKPSRAEQYGSAYSSYRRDEFKVVKRNKKWKLEYGGTTYTKYGH